MDSNTEELNKVDFVIAYYPNIIAMVQTSITKYEEHGKNNFHLPSRKCLTRQIFEETERGD